MYVFSHGIYLPAVSSGIHYRRRDEDDLDEREADGAERLGRDRLGAENDRPELDRVDGALIDGRDALGALDLVEGTERVTLGALRDADGALRDTFGTLDEEERREELIDGALLELRELDDAEGLLLVLLRLVGALRTGVRVEREAFDRVVLRGTLILRDLLLDEDDPEGLLLVMLRLVGALRTGVRVVREELERVVLRGTLVLRDLLLDEEDAELRGDSLTEPLPGEILRLGGALL
ncbi:MAG: hypothetical protein R6V12_06685 [Candidatus Hydrogenedentota bacterium]